ncbi:UvrD-helicase domain-containing protein [Nocardioides sp. NPDC057577]|uniref:UvrD-helicase domain-containing protein n=1 Tax=Nocardioides sp. NPDC057577 TaxID=3346171 RepID=UPI003670715C
MNSSFDDTDAPWHECERAWADWLNQMGYTVHLLSGAVGNATTTLAPLAYTPGPSVRQPDIAAAKAGVTEYWEVKYRSAADVDPLTGVRQHWMERAAFNDYRRLARATQMPVNLILFEAPTATNAHGRWLRASMRELRDAGHEDTRTGRDGERITAWVWPVSAMTEVPGPPLSTSQTNTPILADEGSGEWLDDAALERAERRRRWPAPASEDGPGPSAQAAREDEVARRFIDETHAAGLAAACHRLGLTPVPQYSVTRLGPLGEHADDVLALIDYGVRVFLVSDRPLSSSVPAQQLEAFRGARLLEDAVVTGLPEEVHWAVDGQLSPGQLSIFEAAMARAQDAGGLNYGQWRVVHAPRAENVLVRAGAGTGKTETMSERMVFLLSTQRSAAHGSAEAGELTPEHFAFVTFTREAALQMRARLGRTLMLRQRLCRYCVPPVVAWMLQLSTASISTIHTFAKQTLQQTGEAVGYAPNFRVGQLTMPFRRLLQERLSADLAALNRAMGAADARRVPAAYAWEDHLESVWAGLENNGLPLMQLDGGDPPPFDWGTPHGDRLRTEVLDMTRATLEDVAQAFGELCRDEQVVPTSGLVPLAVSTAATSGDRLPTFRHIFVDEFQDTDALQISLFLEIHQQTGASMFVVGDVKQGIYRFRGAAGNAFSELAERVDDLGLTPFQPYGLIRNFRSGERLLNSLHPFFRYWGQSKWLEYQPDDQLHAGNTGRGDRSTPVHFTDRSWWPDQYAADQAADVISSWRAAHKANSLAILCRENWQARLVQESIHKRGGHCLVYVGGEFFRSPAVVEARALLEVLMAPGDPAALLQLAESRWGAGVLASEPPDVLPEDAAEAWRNAQAAPIDWRSRFGTLASSARLSTGDLRGLSDRLAILQRHLTRSSIVGLLVDCVAWFAPDAVERPGEKDEERGRYSNCLNHLITLISNTFDDGSASPLQVLEWLRLQIATNTDEDEPYEQATLTADGVTVALSVHKAKGLEYHRVVLPFTTKPFIRNQPRKGRTEVSVLRRPGTKAALLWRWSPPGQAEVFANYAQDGADDQENEREAMLEEVRLLYVAMTRARLEVRAFRKPAGHTPQVPNSWSELLSTPGGS